MALLSTNAGKKCVPHSHSVRVCVVLLCVAWPNGGCQGAPEEAL